MFGSPARTWTADPVVNSHLLCQLSYWGIILSAFKTFKNRQENLYIDCFFVSTKKYAFFLLFIIYYFSLTLAEHIVKTPQFYKLFVAKRAGSSVGRASALQAEGHRFKPCSAY